MLGAGHDPGRERRIDRQRARLARVCCIPCVVGGGIARELKRRWQEGGEELEGTTLLGADKVSWREEMALAWEKKLQDAARVAEIDLVALPVRRSAPEKVRLAAVMKATTSVSNGWLAQRLGMGQPASVSQYVRRLRLRGETGANRRSADNASLTARPPDGQ